MLVLASGASPGASSAIVRLSSRSARRARCAHTRSGRLHRGTFVEIVALQSYNELSRPAHARSRAPLSSALPGNAALQSHGERCSCSHQAFPQERLRRLCGSSTAEQDEPEVLVLTAGASTGAPPPILRFRSRTASRAGVLMLAVGCPCGALSLGLRLFSRTARQARGARTHIRRLPRSALAIVRHFSR